jgi:hypothetical protein
LPPGKVNKILTIGSEAQRVNRDHAMRLSDAL